MNKAFEDVMAERRRQVEAEGWTTEHDDQHTRGEMACAAAVYAYVATLTNDSRDTHKGAMWGMAQGFVSIVRMLWPWAPQWFKPTTPRRDLVKAAALLLAEIERRDRAASSTIPTENDTPVRCPQCNWCGRADELGPEGECGADLNCNGRPTEITDPAGLIQAWWDSEGQVAGPQCIAAGLIEPHPATEQEAGELDIEVGDSIWDVSEKGEAAIRAAKAEA